MGRFRKHAKPEDPKVQARRLVSKKLALGMARHTNKDKNLIHSVRTAGAYRETLERTARWMQARGHVDGCRNISAEDAEAYLTERAASVTQKTLNQERQALQKCLPQFDGAQLPRRKATKPPTPLATDSRAYTREQIERIGIRQREDNAFSTHLVASTGMRGIELYTLRRLNEQPSSSHRQWNPERFAGRGGLGVLQRHRQRRPGARNPPAAGDGPRTRSAAARDPPDRDRARGEIRAALRHRRREKLGDLFQRSQQARARLDDRRPRPPAHLRPGAV